MPSCNCGQCDPALPLGSPYTFSNFATKSVAIRYTGAQIIALSASATYPVTVKVGEIDLQTNAGLFALSLSSSITNPVAGVAGVFAAIGEADVINITGMTKLFLSHNCEQNSIAGLPNPSSRSNSLQMGQNSYFRINQGVKIAIYACAPNDASVLVSAVLTAFWIPIQ